MCEQSQLVVTEHIDLYEINQLAILHDDKFILRITMK